MFLIKYYIKLDCSLKMKNLDISEPRYLWNKFITPADITYG